MSGTIFTPPSPHLPEIISWYGFTPPSPHLPESGFTPHSPHLPDPV